jgi:hypothetical protein
MSQNPKNSRTFAPEQTKVIQNVRFVKRFEAMRLDTSSTLLINIGEFLIQCYKTIVGFFK